MRLTDVAPYCTVSAASQKHLETDIVQILQEAQALGTTYAHRMIGTQEARVGRVARDVFSKAKEIAKTVIEHVKNALSSAVQREKEEPEPVSVQEAMEEAMETVHSTLPDLVASYEVHDAIEKAVMQEFKANGVEYVEWVTEPDACEACVANEEQGPIASGLAFQSGHELPPSHAHCKCHIVPSIKK